MNAEPTSGGRLRAYLQFVAAVFYFFLARSLAHRAANGLASESFAPLAEQAMLVVLLLLGYAAFGSWIERQKRPITEQGLPRRAGLGRELALGLSLGWSLALVCVLPMVVAGGIAIVLNTDLAAFGWLLADIAFFALLALGEELAFRGYGFQRLAEALGSMGAVLGFAAYSAIVQALVPGANHASIGVAIALSFVLSLSYLRTRALWLSWGINFGWKASRALVFGLAISGVNSHSPVVQGDPMGPFWVTGGGFGLDGSWITFFVLLAALPVVYRITRDLDYKYNAPVLIPGGIPVDLDAAARRQHEAAMGPAEPAVPGLVQILPVAPPAPLPVPRVGDLDRPSDT